VGIAVRQEGGGKKVIKKDARGRGSVSARGGRFSGWLSRKIRFKMGKKRVSGSDRLKKKRGKRNR